MIARGFIVTIASIALIGAARRDLGGPQRASDEQLRSRCYDVLTRALADDSPWVRVHAAEALIAAGRPEPALAAFRPVADTSEPRYRIVGWRVLAAADPDPGRRRAYAQRIRAALLDPAAPDHTHAMEALAKLREPAIDDEERQGVRAVADAEGPASPFAVWRLAHGGAADAADRLVKLLRSDDPTTRARAAYVLGRLRPLPPEANDAVATAAAKEPAESPAWPMLRAALGGEATRQLARDANVKPSARYFAAMSLADHGTPHDIPILTRLLDDADSDVRVGAAHAILQIERRGAATAPATKPSTRDKATTS